jgi:hypothetical protein
LVSVTGCVPRARGMAWLHCFPCPCRLRTIRCCGFWSGHRLIVPSTYLLMEAGRLVLSCRGFRLFSDQLIGGRDRWRFKHHIEVGPQGWGLRVQVWTGTWTPRQEWNELVLFVPEVQARRVFFRVPSWATLIRESSFLRDGTNWLQSSTVLRIGIWKMVKEIGLLNPCSKVEQVLT